MVELLHGAQQPQRALLHEVGQRHAVLLALVALGDVHDQAQVRLDHAVLGHEVAALDPPREPQLVGRGEQRRARDVGEEAGEAVRRVLHAEHHRSGALKAARRAGSSASSRRPPGLSGPDGRARTLVLHDRSAPLAARRSDRRPPRPRAGAGPGARGAAAARRARPRGRAHPAAPATSARPLAGGLVSATLVSAGAFGFGLIDAGDPPAAAPRAPASAAVSAKQQGDVAAIYKAASPAVVSIRTESGSGTGFVVDTDGTIVTNAHVVGESDRVQVQFADDRTVTGTVQRRRHLVRPRRRAASSPRRTGKLTALQLADSGTVTTGQLAVAIGSPFGLPQTATAGIVSGTGRHIQAPDGFQIDSVIQTDAPINPGNSGGPLLDADGRVIGVNSQIATGGTGQGNVGIGFAVPANTVADVIPRLERGEADPARLPRAVDRRGQRRRGRARGHRGRSRRRARACARAT